MGSAIAELNGQGIGAAGGDRSHPAGRGFACTRIPSIPVESQTVGSLYLLNRNALTHWACAYRYIVYKLFRTHTLQFLGIGGTDYAVERKYEDG